MAWQAGADGVIVFGYNYSREATAGVNADMQFHGSGTYANLSEGNIIGEIAADENSGANGILNTFFRNQVESIGIALSGDSKMTNQNVVGTEVGAGLYSINFGFAYSATIPLQVSNLRRLARSPTILIT